MKYTSELIVNLPREEVIKKLDNPENMKHWQKGLVSYELLSEDPQAIGAKMKLEYKMGKRNVVLTETILKYDFPKEFQATYEAKGVYNIQKNYFQEIDSTTTKWISENEFQFKSLMMKIVGFLMPGSFKKQSMEYLNDFKKFAEKGISVTDK